MRHIFGICGIVAASVLLIVSAAMNWRFGYSLGKTEFDGVVYGLASAAADGLKALMPFLVIAALRARKWTQALAGIFLGVICSAYSLTSSLGFAAQNRDDTIGARQAQVSSYAALKEERKRLTDKLSWIPQHRPAATVQAELDGLLAQPVRSKQFGRGTVRELTSGCTDSNWISRKYCGGIHNARKELAVAKDAQVLEARLNEIDRKLRKTSVKGGATGKADPQAEILRDVTGFELKDIQMGLILLVSLLVEAGSALGFFVAVALWQGRTEERQRIMPRGRLRKNVTPVPEEVLSSHNDNVVVDAISSDKKLVERIAGTAKNMAVDPAVKTPAIETVREEALPTATYTTQVDAEEEPAHYSHNDEEDLEDYLGYEYNQRPMQTASLSVVKRDLERYHDACIDHVEGASTTATALYEHYCDWCGSQRVEPLALPDFSNELNLMGIKKSKIAGRIRYVSIRLKPGRGEGQSGKNSRMVA